MVEFASRQRTSVRLILRSVKQVGKEPLLQAESFVVVVEPKGFAVNLAKDIGKKDIESINRRASRPGLPTFNPRTLPPFTMGVRSRA